jgi:transcriptional regulator GlxA family with amidase domain
MEIAFLLYDGFTALDAVGPYEVLSRIPGAQVKFVAGEPGPKITETHSLTMVAEHSLADVHAPEIIVVPGGFGTRRLLEDEQLLDWIRAAHEQTTWTTSVCTGSLLLGAAGVLEGLRATTHWAVLERLAEFGAIPTKERVVEEGKVVTAAGVSSGIDMGLRLAERIGGEDLAKAIQLGIEYDPDPPFDAGSPDTAPPHLVEMLKGVLVQAEAEAQAT